ncbi:MAG TPA: hypothetical protein VEV17_11975 [Bryobacteraceae bacterium]|nr:hypothetical protein [Bryobacteraceae bacterium]
MDVWIAIGSENAQRLAGVLHEFGFTQAQAETFLEPRKIVRLGVPPVRLEILTSITGVDFASCYARRCQVELDGVLANLIHLDDLKRNKQASGRLKDRLDLEQLL